MLSSSTHMDRNCVYQDLSLYFRFADSLTVRLPRRNTSAGSRGLSKRSLIGGALTRFDSVACQRLYRPMSWDWARMWPCMARSTSALMAPGLRRSFVSRA